MEDGAIEHGQGQHGQDQHGQDQHGQPAALSNAAMQTAAARVAATLRRRGLRPGDRVAVLADNSAGVLAVVWGALRAGIVPAMINTALSPAQIIGLLEDVRPSLVLGDHANGGVLDRAGRPADLRIAPTPDAGWPLDGPRSDDADLARFPVARAMHFTSGTSGQPKGVWAGVLGEALGRAWAEDEAAANPTGADDVHLVCSHLFHSGPLRYAMNTLNQGGRVVVQPGFDAARTLRLIAAERVTTAFMVPTHLSRLLDEPALAAADLSSLRWIHHAGAACPEPLKRRAIEALGADVLWEFYGSTEGQFSAISTPEWLRRPGSVGRARRGRSLTVTDPESGEVLAPGQIGTVWVSSPAFGRFEYWDAPAKTAAAWDGDRFTVGDLGHLDDDGYLYLSGRREDLIVTGGVNVYPAEVERTLLAHPGVREGVVYGVAHPDWGQQVTAAVIPRRGVSLDAEEVRGFLRQRLAGFQTPKVVRVVDELPRTASGKVIRAALREEG